MDDAKFSARLLLICLVVVSSALIACYGPTSSCTSSDEIQVALSSSENSSIDQNLQTLSQKYLDKGISESNSKRGLALILEANTGNVVAVASSNPHPEQGGCDESKNLAIKAWQPGSVIKPLTIAASLNEAAINLDSKYENNGVLNIGESVVSNAIWSPKGDYNLKDILGNSMNTGAVFALRKLGENNIDLKARQKLYNYFADHYRLTSPTNLVNSGEEIGYISSPNLGSNLEFIYASMSYGTNMTVTPIELAAAYASMVNGGVYFQPRLQAGKPKIVRTNVITPETSESMVKLLTEAIELNNKSAMQPGYLIGGKTGTAPVAGGDGAYKIDRDIGTYIGFIGTTKPNYILLTRLDEPETNGFASAEAAKIWANISNEMIAQKIVN